MVGSVGRSPIKRKSSVCLRQSTNGKKSVCFVAVSKIFAFLACVIVAGASLSSSNHNAANVAVCCATISNAFSVGHCLHTVNITKKKNHFHAFDTKLFDSKVFQFRFDTLLFFFVAVFCCALWFTIQFLFSHPVKNLMSSNFTFIHIKLICFLRL